MVFKSSVQIDEDSCLRNKWECRKCILDCPENAISIKDDRLHIDDILCTSCNLCVSSCYSSAISTRDLAYLRSLGQIQSQSQSIWVCQKNKDKSEGGVNFSCYHTIDPHYIGGLFLAGFDHKVQIDTSYCDNCDICKSKNILDLIDRFKARPSSFTIEDTVFSPKENTNMGKREFFSEIGHMGKKVQHKAMDQLYEDLGYRDIDPKDTIIQRLVSDSLDKDRDFGGYEDYIFNLAIDETCSLCKKCTSYCPSQALSFKASDSTMTISFDPSLCNYCGLCMEVCPNSSISRIVLTSLEPYVLYAKSNSRCLMCRRHDTSLDSNGLCPSCQVKSKYKTKKEVTRSIKI